MYFFFLFETFGNFLSMYQGNYDSLERYIHRGYIGRHDIGCHDDDDIILTVSCILPSGAPHTLCKL